MSISKRIKEARKKRGLTLDRLAKEVGSSKSYIWQLENSSEINPSAKLISKIALALDVTHEHLMQDEYTTISVVGKKVTCKPMGNVSGNLLHNEHWNTSFERLENQVIEWGKEKGIIGKTTIRDQLLKTVEELGELSGAVLKGNDDDTIDGFGDVIVTLILAHHHFSGGKSSIVSCLQSAYDEIKDRTGRIENGNFIKDS